MYGEKIKEIRRELGLSQKEFSEKLGISTMALSRLETNDSSLKIELISKIEGLGINLDWLVVNKGEMFLEDNNKESISVVGEYNMELKRLRKEKGFTQSELAEKLGISQNYLSEIETGKVALTDRLKIALGELGLFIVEETNGIVSIPLIDISASAGLGIFNLSECPQVSLIDVPSELLDIPPIELRNCHAIKVRGNSMTPVLENGDRVIVKEVKEIPSYLEGLHIVIYDKELYVKNIQLGNNKLVMKSLNREFEDIVISNLRNLDTHLQIVAKVMTIIRSI